MNKENYKDICRMIARCSSGLEQAKDALSAFGRLRWQKVVILPPDVEVRQEGEQVDTKEAISTIRDIRRKYEMEIASAIGPILRRFEDESGMNALGVYVGMMEVTEFQDERPRFAVERVNIDVERM